MELRPYDGTPVPSSSALDDDLAEKAPGFAVGWSADLGNSRPQGDSDWETPCQDRHPSRCSTESEFHRTTHRTEP